MVSQASTEAGGGDEAAAPGPKPRAKTKTKSKKKAAAVATEAEPAIVCVPTSCAMPISTVPACSAAPGAAPPGSWIVDAGSGNHLISADKLKKGLETPLPQNGC